MFYEWVSPSVLANSYVVLTYGIDTVMFYIYIFYIVFNKP